VAAGFASHVQQSGARSYNGNSMTALISVTDFHKNYGETIAVSGLSFEAAAGTVLGMLGPNGAGKTTTLRAIAGILPPTRGRLSVAGHDVVSEPIPAKRQVAYVPDDPKLFDTLTVWEHLDFMASVYGVADFTGYAEQLLDQFELTAKRDTAAGELSRGMRQKVALCCAYLHDPTAILLDEPMTGLDPHGIRTLKDSIRQRAASGATLIISSHLLSLIEDLCTHLLIMVQGRSLFCGTKEDARKKYPHLDGETSLERIFFLATEKGHEPSPD
jgi:ABC-2 type transport system ATP-binding protein